MHTINNIKGYACFFEQNNQFVRSILHAITSLSSNFVREILARSGISIPVARILNFVDTQGGLFSGKNMRVRAPFLKLTMET
jgi:hypothetical protein